VKRVVLRHSGHTGLLATGQTNVSAGTFEFNSNGLAGVLFDGSVTVEVTPFTRFLGGLTGIGDLTGNTAFDLRVVGLILKTNTGVEKLTNLRTKTAGGNSAPTSKWPHLSACRVEQQTGTGKARFRFLQLGNVQRLDRESLGFDSGARLRKRCGENDGFANSQRIPRVWLRSIHIYPLKLFEAFPSKPSAVAEERIPTEIGDGGLKVQATGYRHSRQFVSEMLCNYRQLSYPLGV